MAVTMTRSKGGRAVQDLTGKKFGMLTALHSYKEVGKPITWVCKCDCGETREVSTGILNAGKATSCGCKSMKEDFTGRVYGQLTVVRFHGYEEYKGNRKLAMWECLCTCGNTHVAYGPNLKKGFIQSCGCSSFVDYTGVKSGKLTVVSYAGVEDNHRMWKCLCSCGGTTFVRARDLSTGNRKSCGCMPRVLPKQGCGDLGVGLYSRFARGAGIRGYEFNVTIEYLWDLYLRQGKKCALSGVPLILGRYGDITASLDRVDSTKGYTEDNVQWVHKVLNKLKMNTPNQEFIDWCKAIANFNSDFDESEYTP